MNPQWIVKAKFPYRFLISSSPQKKKKKKNTGHLYGKTWFFSETDIIFLNYSIIYYPPVKYEFVCIYKIIFLQFLIMICFYARKLILCPLLMLYIIDQGQVTRNHLSINNDLKIIFDFTSVIKTNLKVTLKWLTTLEEHY